MALDNLVILMQIDIGCFFVCYTEFHLLLGYYIELTMATSEREKI